MAYWLGQYAIYFGANELRCASGDLRGMDKTEGITIETCVIFDDT